jgi:hypothetical protein
VYPYLNISAAFSSFLSAFFYASSLCLSLFFSVLQLFAYTFFLSVAEEDYQQCIGFVGNRRKKKKIFCRKIFM